MHFLRCLSVTAIGLGFLGVSSPARAGGAGGNERIVASHGDDAVSRSPQSEGAPIGPPRDPNARRDPSMFGWGLTLAIAGGASAIAGTVAFTIGAEDTICFTAAQCSHQAEGRRIANVGTALIIGGTALMGIGIPLAVIGGRRVRPGGPPSPHAMLVPVVGPGHAGSAFTLTF